MSNQDHPINARPKRSMSGANDWESGGMDVPSSPERPLVIPDNAHVRDMPVTWIGDPPGVAADKTIADHERSAKF